MCVRGYRSAFAPYAAMIAYMEVFDSEFQGEEIMLNCWVVLIALITVDKEEAEAETRRTREEKKKQLDNPTLLKKTSSWLVFFLLEETPL